MYKTIRHGENSLQYTILPQNDDFRIEGKLTSAESSCSSSGRKSKTKRPRRRSFFAYLGLIFVCTVIVGAVLIPFLVSAECLPNPTEWFLGKNAEKHEKPASALKSHGNTAFNAAHSNFIGSGINIGKTVKIINQAGVEKVVLRVNKTNSNATIQKSNLNANYQNNSGNENVSVNENTVEQQKLLTGTTTPAVNVQSITQNDIHKSAPDNGLEIKTENFQNQNSYSAQTNTQLKGDLGIAQTQAQNTANNQLNQNLNNQFADNPPNKHFVTEVRFEPVDTVSSKPPGAIPTIVVTTLRNQFTNNEVPIQQLQQQQQHQEEQFKLPQQEQFIVQSQTAPNVRPTTTFSSSISAVNNASNSTTPTSSLMTRIIQVPLLKAAAKKPIIPPVLVKTNSQVATVNGQVSVGNGDLPLATSSPLSQQPGETSVVIDNNSAETVVEPAKPNDWMHAHWPFIDPSTYFQWTGYKAEDSVLLPALLGFTLVAIISIITVCLVARKKQTILSSIRKRNRNDVEENGAEDNATLLTTANLSDED